VNLPLQTLDLDGEIIGETLIAFDALDIDGDLTATAYSNRLARLLDLLQAWDNGIFGEPMPPRVSVLPCPTWFTTEEKTAGYAQEFDRRGEGVVFRKADAPYRPGRCRQNYKLKFTKTLTALVTAIHIDKKGRPDPSKQNAALALLDPPLTSGYPSEKSPPSAKRMPAASRRSSPECWSR